MVFPIWERPFIYRKKDHQLLVILFERITFYFRWFPFYPSARGLFFCCLRNLLSAVGFCCGRTCWIRFCCGCSFLFSNSIVGVGCCGVFVLSGFVAGGAFDACRRFVAVGTLWLHRFRCCSRLFGCHLLWQYLASRCSRCFRCSLLLVLLCFSQISLLPQALELWSHSYKRIGCRAIAGFFPICLNGCYSRIGLFFKETWIAALSWSFTFAAGV